MIADIGLSASFPSFMQSESFLAHQRHLERGQGASNCHALFGMKKIRADNYIRLMLDKVPPETLQPCFDRVLDQLASAADSEHLNADGCWRRLMGPRISVRKN